MLSFKIYYDFYSHASSRQFVNELAVNSHDVGVADKISPVFRVGVCELFRR